MKYKDIDKSDKRLFCLFMRSKLRKDNAPKISGGPHKLISIYRGRLKTDPIKDFFHSKSEVLKSIQTKDQTPTGFIYFIGSEGKDFNYVKIGYSKKPDNRLKQLQTGSPVKLKVLLKFEGNLNLEAKLHRKFKNSRLEGEWFRISSSLKHYLKHYI